MSRHVKEPMQRGRRSEPFSELCLFAGIMLSDLGFCSGVIAGLVAVTPAAGNSGPFGAIVLGAVASIICFYAVTVLKPKLGYDDSLDAFGIHGIGGMIGAIGTAIVYSLRSGAYVRTVPHPQGHPIDLLALGGAQGTNPGNQFLDVGILGRHLHIGIRRRACRHLRLEHVETLDDLVHAVAG